MSFTARPLIERSLSPATMPVRDAGLPSSTLSIVPSLLYCAIFVIAYCVLRIARQQSLGGRTLYPCSSAQYAVRLSSYSLHDSCPGAGQMYQAAAKLTVDGAGAEICKELRGRGEVFDFDISAAHFD